MRSEASEDFMVKRCQSRARKVNRARVVATADIRAVAKSLRTLPQVDLPVVNRFADGVYMRELVMPAGVFVVGKEHRTEHLNVMLTGRATLLIDGKRVEAVAPFVCKSKPATMKVAFVHEEVRWLTVHPNPDNKKNVRRLENRLTIDDGGER